MLCSRAKEDRALVKKLKEDNAIAVRTDGQQSELRGLNAGTRYLNYTRENDGTGPSFPLEL